MINFFADRSDIFLDTFIVVCLLAIIYLLHWRQSHKRDTQARLNSLAERLAAREKELQEVNDRLQIEIARHQEAEKRLTEQKRQAAATEEREEIARDLQDNFGQALGYINAQAQAARALLKKGQTEVALENLSLLSQTALGARADLRSYLLGIRGAEKERQSFFESLLTYLNVFSSSWGIETVFSLPSQDTLPIFSETVETQLLHIIQEALVNIRKHAQAKRVEVLMTFLPREMILVVSDDGRGFDLQTAPGIEQKCFGLSIMRERAEQIGGQVEARSELGKGTQVVAHIPRILFSMPKDVPEDLLGARILLADDEPLSLEGIRNVLTARGLTVIGLARDGHQAVEQTRMLRPDIVFMDAQMSHYSGMEAVRLIKKEFPDIKVVLFTAAEDEETFLEAVKLGVSGYFLKSMDTNDMFFALAAIIRGESAIPHTLVSHFLSKAPPSENLHQETLTARQWEILQLVAKGLTYKEVAKVLHISEVTIKYHMAQIIERLHVKNREQAVLYALRATSK